MMMATVSAVAVIFFSSCKSKLSEAEKLDLSSTPLQVVDSMNLIQTTNGVLEMRVVTGRMERYETDSTEIEKFPEGLNIYAYTNGGELESTIRSNEATHERNKKSAEEIWRAFGNVVVKNLLKQETMETDTIYWDRKNQEIYTDCYIRFFSPDGFTQGYGMRSDERARNSKILRPFNNYMIVVKDSTEVYIDSANFIGPLPPPNFHK